MAIYTSKELNSASGAWDAHLAVQGQVRQATTLQPATAQGAVIDRLGPRPLTLEAGMRDGELVGNTGVLAGHLLGADVATLAGFLALQGGRHQGAAFQVSAYYRQGDRITLSGYALDLAGAPLRQVQLQFIGETVQDHFFGAATNLDGIYVAFLDTGDTYTAYAFHPATGITYRLEARQEAGNQTNLRFQQITPRMGWGDGIYLQGA